MNTPALDKLLAQGKYTLEVVGFEVQAILKGEGLHPVTQTALTLAIALGSELADTNSRDLSVRIVGPATTFDRTEDGQVLVGACRVSSGECEIVVMATEAFLSHCLMGLSTMPRTRCLLSIITQSEIERSTEGYVFVFEAAFQSKLL